MFLCNNFDLYVVLQIEFSLLIQLIVNTRVVDCKSGNMLWFYNNKWLTKLLMLEIASEVINRSSLSISLTALCCSHIISPLLINTYILLYQVILVVSLLRSKSEHTLLALDIILVHVHPPSTATGMHVSDLASCYYYYYCYYHYYMWPSQSSRKSVCQPEPCTSI